MSFALVNLTPTCGHPQHLLGTKSVFGIISFSCSVEVVSAVYAGSDDEEEVFNNNETIDNSLNNNNEDVIRKSFRVCGQVKDVNIDEIVSFQDGRLAAEGRCKLKELFELNPKDIDYNLLKRQHEETVLAEVMNVEPNEVLSVEAVADILDMELEYNHTFNDRNVYDDEDPLGNW